MLNQATVRLLTSKQISKLLKTLHYSSNSMYLCGLTSALVVLKQYVNSQTCEQFNFFSEMPNIF